MMINIKIINYQFIHYSLIFNNKLKDLNLILWLELIKIYKLIVLELI